MASNNSIYSNGYIVNSRDYSNTSSIVTIFTNKYIKTAIVKGSRTKQKINSCNHGNLVNFCHFGREGGLGVFAIEPLCNPLIANMQNQTNMLIVFSACELIFNLCGEFSPNQALIYSLFDLLIQELCKKNHSQEVIFKIFQKLELSIIDPAGQKLQNLDGKIMLNWMYLYQLLLNELKLLDVCKTKFAARNQLHLNIINA